MAAAAREEAKILIDKFRKKWGGLTEEQREILKRTMPDALEANDELREALGAITRTLTTQLYSKNTRFVYELIQNAEDNNYYAAHDKSEDPQLRFSLYPDRIVIDSNEDGFSKSNVEAICSVGQSTKKNVHGYIGEKGIGFKSVFKVARKVHVQSEPYSFTFKYQYDGNDNGLGMVTPMNEDYLTIDDHWVRTRMILYILDNCDRTALHREFSDLPDTLLLFLQKLKQLTIRTLVEGCPEVQRTYSLLSSGDRVSIEKTVTHLDSSKTITTQHYWITRRSVTKMPNDPARKKVHTAEVVLAFPLDANNIPIIKEQYVSAFLPLKKVGYKFLIQSDFVTQSSREDAIVCPWNNRLLNEIKEAFLGSIDRFLRHPTLKYHWVRYIPADAILDEFWDRLQRELSKALSSRTGFMSHGSDQHWTANQLRIVTEEYRGDDTQPLVPDLCHGPSAYISEAYDSTLDLPVMKKLGARELCTSDFLDRLRKDLDSTHPRIRSTPLDAQWHTKVADLLVKALSIPEDATFIKKLPIVPLNNGKWVHSLNASIFFPTSGGVNVPVDLSLCLVDANVLHNKSRKKLLTRLGITECHPSRIVPVLVQQYGARGTIDLQNSISHVKFMFWHNNLLPSAGFWMVLASTNDPKWFNPRDLKRGWTYSPHSESPYSMSKIFDTSVPDGLRDKMRFAHLEYYRMLRMCGSRHNKTGEEWFEEFANIKHTPQFLRRGSNLEISPELQYISKERPEFLLGILEANQKQYCNSDMWDDYFKSTKVPILHSNELRELETTYLPRPELKAIVACSGLEEDFGFVKELDDITDITADKWRFLKRFGVGIEEDVSFWLALLKQASEKENIKGEIVFKAYKNLLRFARDEDIEKIKKAFVENWVVFIPPNDSEQTPGWTQPEHCVWNSPEWFDYKHRLNAIDQYRNLPHLFQTILGVTDANYSDYTAYLQEISDPETDLTPNEKEYKTARLYEVLNKCVQDGIPPESIRSAFENDELIYNPGVQSWHKRTSCIWAKDQIQLPGKFSLATRYNGLKWFFVGVLGIAEPTLEDHVQALVEKASKSPNKRDIVEEMNNICAFGPTSESLNRLASCKCFPVKLTSGDIQWLDSSKDFAIVDRREYGETFADEVNILDFSLEEVHSLKSLLDGLRLDRSYMSKMVKEETTAQSGSINQRLTDDLRKKAYAICRYAAHLGSNQVLEDTLTAYRTLQNVDVYTSDNISKSVSINQNNRVVTITRDTAYFHLEKQGGKLNFYVPKSRKRRQVCLSRHLPDTLLEYFGARREASSGGLSSIITASNLFVVDEILQYAGIIEVEGIRRLEDDSGYKSSSSEDEGTPGGSVGGAASQHNAAYLPSTTLSGLNDSEDPSLTPVTTALGILSSPAEQPDLYKELLDAVIRQAESISDLPIVGCTVKAKVSTITEFETSLAVDSPYNGEKEFKIGAAGELFVFELLKSLALPDFTLENWQSKIRDRVSVHERYQELAPWSFPETADIVYHDRSGRLTQLLIEKRYLEQSIWEGQCPEYCIEVKCTTGPLKMPFYCSPNQYELMELRKLTGSKISNKIYLIARVFALGDSGMEMKLYLDPATLRRDGVLKFRADKYVVTPVT